MTIEKISGSISTKVMLLSWELNFRPQDLQYDTLPKALWSSAKSQLFQDMQHVYA